MEQFQPVLGRLVSGLGALTLGAAAMLLSVGAGSLARNAGRSERMRSALFSVVLSVVATLVCGNVSAQPAAVTNLTAQEDDRRVTLSWDNPGGSITNYEYRQSTDGGATWSDWAYIYVNRGTTRHTATLTELTNGTAYTFQVRAVSAAGNGAESASETATPELKPLMIGLSSEDISGTLDDTIDVARGWTTEMQVVVTGGRKRYKYSLESPASFQHIEIDSTSGLIEVKPDTIGNFAIRVRVKDAVPRTETHDFTLRVTNTLTIRSIRAKVALKDSSITPIQVFASGGSTPYEYSITRAPAGVSIDSSSGQITGAPTESGHFTVKVTVEDDNGTTATREFPMGVYTMALAEKFSPILILTEHPTIKIRRECRRNCDKWRSPVS